jgi:hypothetical protein
MNASDQSQPIRAKEVSYRDVGGETVLLNLSTGVYYGLNEVGAFIWQRLDGKHTLDDLVRSVCSAYAVDRERALADVRRLVEELLNAGLIDASKVG